MSEMRDGLTLDELEIGQSAELTHTVSESDVLKFADASGDHNPLHVDEAYAARTMFRGRIAHGLLPASFVSAVVGTMLPGPGSIYLGQTLSFHRPTRIGDTCVARVEVVGIDRESARVTLRTTCAVDGELVLEGEATVRVPRRRRPARA